MNRRDQATRHGRLKSEIRYIVQYLDWLFPAKVRTGAEMADSNKPFACGENASPALR
ncbi:MULTISPECIES: hypothetical protein [unclassified Bradyrhizobium]|uniref:hypothetical protein n=1 Tax=unclassified Bradyrhizobium TaxID=2631580 RepID=UPI00143D8F8A|nr:MULTISPECIES: hypothetical protein [unclassified Bradyrhizobium]